MNTAAPRPIRIMGKPKPGDWVGAGVVAGVVEGVVVITVDEVVVAFVVNGDAVVVAGCFSRVRETVS
jgi:hypothetical protein